MTPVEAAAAIRDQMKEDPDLRRVVAGMVGRSGCSDIYQWCEKHPKEAVALAEQFADIDGQIANMNYLLSQGDLS